MTSTTLAQQKVNSIGLLTALTLAPGLLVHRLFLLLALVFSIMIPLGQLSDYLRCQFSHA